MLEIMTGPFENPNIPLRDLKLCLAVLKATEFRKQIFGYTPITMTQKWYQSKMRTREKSTARTEEIGHWLLGTGWLHGTVK